MSVLKQVVRSSIALSELKGVAYTLTNPYTSERCATKEAPMSSEIDNVITAQDKLYQALSSTDTQIDHACIDITSYDKLNKLKNKVCSKVVHN